MILTPKKKWLIAGSTIGAAGLTVGITVPLCVSKKQKGSHQEIPASQSLKNQIPTPDLVELKVPNLKAEEISKPNLNPILNPIAIPADPVIELNYVPNTIDQYIPTVSAYEIYGPVVLPTILIIPKDSSKLSTNTIDQIEFVASKMQDEITALERQIHLSDQLGYDSSIIAGLQADLATKQIELGLQVAQLRP